jgi:ABC-type amino acid transport system permease subunit
MTPARAMQYIILPQAVRLMLPPITNFSIVLLKDTALVSVVAAPEIMFYARNLVTETFLSMHVYLLAALIYLSMTIPMARVVAALERSRKAWR